MNSCEIQYKCKHCDNLFVYDSEHLIYLKTDTGENQCICSRCTKGLKHIVSNVCKITYMCDLCDMVFTYKNNLTKHIRSLHDGIQRSQYITAFENKEHLAEHLRSYTGETLHQCRQCPKAFTCAEELNTHHRIHNGRKPYKCIHCDKSFSTNDDLISHQRTTTMNKLCQCNYCDTLFACYDQLLIHMANHSSEKPFQCEICHNSFKERIALVKHIQTHKDNFINTIFDINEGNTERKINNSENMGKPEFEELEAQIDGENCDKKDLFVLKEKSIDCEQSEGNVGIKADKVYLGRHLKSHTGEKTYQCGQCDMAFSSKSNLMKHKESNKGKKTYHCGRCDIAFANSVCLVSHLRSHTGEKTHLCVQCDMAFSCKANLTKHIRFIHDGNQHSQRDTAYSIKVHQCRQCPKTFTCVEELKTHRMIHYDSQPYKCIHCDKCFSFIGDSISHLRTHILESPYQCNYCENSFACNDQLLIHMANHTLEKAFQCEICHNLFKERIVLVKHIQTHKENFINTIFDINEGNMERKINNSENVSRPEFGVIETQLDGENCDEKDLFDLKVEIKEDSIDYEQSESTFDNKIKGLKRENENDGDQMFTTIWNEIKVEVKDEEINVTN